MSTGIDKEDFENVLVIMDEMLPQLSNEQILTLDSKVWVAIAERYHEEDENGNS